MGRTLVIGDIHGCLTALETVLNLAKVRSDDLLVTLGDYVDRGPHSRQVLDWLIDRERDGNLIALRGNHDLMMSDARFNNQTRNGWISVGGVQTLQSYGDEGIIGTLEDVPERHFEFIDNTCRRHFETPTHIFVHAMLAWDKPLEEQSDEYLYWVKFRDPQPHCSGKIMVCGHTAQKNGEPLNVGHAVCIDTWVYGHGWLTCLDVESGEYWQAKQSRESRSGQL